MWIELHTHSWYSKGTILGEESVDSPIQIVKEAIKKGLQGIAITDHDSFKSWESLKNLKFDNFLIIPGEEIYTKQGHLLALGITEEIKPKQDVLETIDKIHSQGGIAIAPHPFDIGKFGIRNFSKYADAIEIFNANNLDRFANLRAKKFASRFKKVAVVGTDAHMKGVIGKCAIKLDADYDLDSVLRAIRKNRILELRTEYLKINEIVNWWLARLNRNYDRALHYIEKNYNFAKKTIAKNLIKQSHGRTVASKATISFLTYTSFVLLTTYSFLINAPKCLV